MKRRDLLKALPLGMAAAAVPFSFGGFAGRAFGKSPLLSALTNTLSTNSDRVLVLINLQGGNDGLNTIIPFNDPLYATNRPDIGFTASALANHKIRPDLAINPNMDFSGGPQLLKMFNEGKLAIMQNVGYADPNRSHFRSTDIWNTASDSNVIVTTGWVGRYLESLAPNYPIGVAKGDDPLAIEIGTALSPVFQGSQAEMGLAITDPSKFTAASSYSDDPVPNTPAGAELDFIRSILLQSDVYGDRFKSLFPSTPQSAVSYNSANPLATQLQKVAWCIGKGMSTKVYFVSLGSFDTHINQYSDARDTTGQGQLLYWLADAISTFQADLEKMGVADRVIGMTYSEFGRRVEQNASKGTDHGTCAPQFVFGTQVNGDLYGAAPNLSDLDANGDLKWQTDFRQLYTAILGDWFGLDQSLQKSILFDSTNGHRFLSQFQVNGSSKVQGLIRTPADAVAAAAANSFVLHQNYPNPFNPSTTIRFALAESAFVRLEVYDGRGSLVRTLVQERLGRGEHRAMFDASGLTSGVYYYRLEAGHTVQTKAMELLK